jgi:hypothetical protein
VTTLTAMDELADELDAPQHGFSAIAAKDS